MTKAEQFQELISLLKDMKHKISIVVMREAGFDDVSFKHCQVLEFLTQEGSCHMKTLAEAFHLSTAAVTKIVDRLEEGGYAQRAACAEDRRKVMVEITPKGRGEVDLFRRNMTAIISRSLENFTEDEVRTICKFYRSVSKNLDEKIAEGSS